MELLILIFVVVTYTLVCFTLDKLGNLTKAVKAIETKVNEVEEDSDEYSVLCLNKYTTFRVRPFFNGVKTIWDVQYRNPADTKWKVCRVEGTEAKAREEMMDLIETIKKG